jgi:predicted  nucleic acid-binding Zn-ribbon protein
MNREKVIKRRRKIKSEIRKLQKEQEEYYHAHDAFENIEYTIYDLEKEYDKLSEKLKPARKK